MKAIFSIFLTFTLVSCSTRYQSSGLTGGYEELQLDENMFSVSFRGNGYTRKQKTVDFCLLRCAELTKDYGFNYFSIIDQRNDTTNSTYTTPSSSVTTGSVNSYGGINAYTTNYGGQTYNVSKPSTANTIICFKTKPASGVSYNAEFLIKSIGGKYGISKFQAPAPSELQTQAQPNPNIESSVPVKNAIPQSQKEAGRKRALELYLSREITRDEYKQMMQELN